MNNISCLVLGYFFISIFSCSRNERTVKSEVTQIVAKDIIVSEFQLNKLNDSIPKNVHKLITEYDKVIGYENNYIIFKDGSKLLYDDKKEKNYYQLLNSPDIEDQFKYEYSYKGANIPKNHDPGRIRNEEFFKKIYGKNKQEVRKKLVEVVWCPKLVNQKILISTENNVHLKVVLLSKELDKHPEFIKYLTNIGGTFNWRKISGTDRLSMHSFGVAIDINVSQSNYWKWDYKSDNKNINLSYRNRIPLELVKIFEKYGFIWGGNWYHYDTMHFEYRPELL